MLWLVIAQAVIEMARQGWRGLGGSEGLDLEGEDGELARLRLAESLGRTQEARARAAARIDARIAAAGKPACAQLGLTSLPS